MATAFRFVSSDDAGAPAASIAGGATLAQYITFIEAIYDHLLLSGASPWTKTVVDSRFTRYTMSDGTGRSFEVDHGATVDNGFEVRGVNTDGSKFPVASAIASGTFSWWRRESNSSTDGVRNWWGFRSDRFMCVVLACGSYIVRPARGFLASHIFGDIISSLASDPHATVVIGGRASISDTASGSDGGVMETVHLDSSNRYFWPASPDGIVQSPVGLGFTTIARQTLERPDTLPYAPNIPMCEIGLVARTTATGASGGYLRGRMPFIRTISCQLPNTAEDTFQSGGITYLHVGSGYVIPLSDNEPGWG